MSENHDYSLVRQYLILSDTHQRSLQNCYEAIISYHQNTTNVLLQYMENRWFQDTRIDRIVARNQLQTFTRASVTTRDTSSNTSQGTETSTREINYSPNSDSHPRNRRRRVFFSDAPSVQTMSRNTIRRTLNIPQRISTNTNLRDSRARVPPPPPPQQSENIEFIPPPSRPPPRSEPIAVPRTSSISETTSLIDSLTGEQNNNTETTTGPRARSNSMMEPSGRRRLRRPRSRPPTIPFRLPNLVPTTTETELINTSYDSPVRIRPSVRQIRNATEVIIYSQLPQDTRDIQSRCPIDIGNFSPEDAVLRIRHCGHIFREMNLRQHFRRNPRCPLCRFDIRDYVASSSNSSTPPTSTSVRNAREVLDQVGSTLDRIGTTLGINQNFLYSDLSANTTSPIHTHRISERTNGHEE